MAIPIAPPDDKPFQEIVEQHFTIGVTSSEEVSAELGEPRLAGDDWWLYKDMRDGWGWFFCVGAAYSASCGTLPRSSNGYFLRVEFDDNDVLSQIELLDENRLCERRRICFEDDLVMRAADEVSNRAEKQFRVPPAGCSVYTYSGTGRNSAAGALIVDGETVGALVGRSGFYSHNVAPGKHAWVLVPNGELLRGAVARIDFDCEEGQLAFIRYSYSLLGVEMEFVKSARAKRDIQNRWLAISTPEYGETNRSSWLRDGEIFVTENKTSLTAYQFVDSDKFPRWGVSYSGEPCGMRDALESYGLAPIGAPANLTFAKTLFSPVELRGVCSASSECEFASVFNGEWCTAEPVTDVEFSLGAKLLVIEPQGDSVAEIFYGDADVLKKLADCEKHLCTVSLERLRQLPN